MFTDGAMNILDACARDKSRIVKCLQYTQMLKKNGCRDMIFCFQESHNFLQNVQITQSHNISRT